jgi:hypothetical protein
MSSLVRDFQRDIVQSKKSVTELLRTAKLISAKLSLTDINAWVGHELGGYSDVSLLPSYRFFNGGVLFAFNPMRGWQRAGYVKRKLPVLQSMPELEELGKGNAALPLIGDQRFDLDGIANSFSQQLEISGNEFTGLINAVRDRLLDWSTELEARGILGNDMTFDSQERQSAQNQVFNIQHFTGVLGAVSHSTVQVYDYSSLHQVLKQHNVPQEERNDLENIMDDLKKAEPSNKTPLLDRAKQWITKNAEFLGSSIGIVRKALGLGE